VSCNDKDIAIDTCVGSVRGPQEVGSSKDDAVSIGSRKVYDLAGNFKEWTQTPHSSNLAIGGGTAASGVLGVSCRPGSAPTNCADPQSGKTNPALCECDGGECWRLCPGELLDTALCAPLFADDEVVTDTDPRWTPDELIDSHVAKGGYWDMSKSSFCEARSANTARARDLNPGYLSIGIRCAATAGQHPDCPLP
jgi:hypothetical protein